jgi:transcriptional regulator with XRE-family HTH domain
MERSKMPEIPEGPQEQTRAFIQKILREKQWTANRLAAEAKVSKGTISRALNDSRFVTSTTTLAKIARAADAKLPEPAKASSRLGGPFCRSSYFHIMERLLRLGSLDAHTPADALKNVAHSSVFY